MAGAEAVELTGSHRRAPLWVDGLVGVAAALCVALTASNWLVVEDHVKHGYNISAGVGFAVVSIVGVVLAAAALATKTRGAWGGVAVLEVILAGAAIALVSVGLAQAPAPPPAVWEDRGGGYAAATVAIVWAVLAVLLLALSFRRQKTIAPTADRSYRDTSTLSERINTSTGSVSADHAATSTGSTGMDTPAEHPTPSATTSSATERPTGAYDARGFPQPLSSSTVMPTSSGRRAPRPAVDTLVALFWIAALLSVIGGIVIGISASEEVKRTNDIFGDTTTTYDGSIIFAGVVAGIFSAALWAALGVGLRLLAEIADNTRPLPLPSAGSPQEVLPEAPPSNVAATTAAAARS